MQDDRWIHGGDLPPESEDEGRRGDSRRGARGPRSSDWRRRPWVRRTLNGVALLLVLGGAGLLSYPFATNMWADRTQDRLTEEFTSTELRTAYVQRQIKPGEALTRLQIPSLGVDTIVVEGVTPSALRAGSGHWDETSLPCEKGNSAIAGHRTTYSKPFAEIDRMKPGDEIILETPIGKCWYRVEAKPWLIDDGEWKEIVKPMGGAHLTLSTCHPPGSTAQRLLVRAKLVKTQFRAEDGSFVDVVR